MALRVWLPLDGDLRNLGCSNVTVTNNGATVNANGKIGSCYEFGTNKYIKLINYAADFLTYNEFSLSVWFKCTAQNTAHTGSALISGGNWNQANNLLQFSLGNFSTDHYTRLLISGSGDWGKGYSYNFYLNTWYHVVLTSGNGKMRAYVNGQLIGDTYNAFKPASLEQTWICIGNGTYSQIFHFIGLMNDLRIYDHCLSAAEVREIAQGLVLHYKLDGFMGGTNSNLAQGSKNLTIASATTNCNISKRGAAVLETRADGFAQVKGTAAWQGFSLWSDSLNLRVGTTYTYSFYGYTALSTSTNAGISFYPMMYNSAGTRDTSSKMPISVMGGAFTNVNSKQIEKLSTTPQLYWTTFTWNQTMADILANGGKIELSIQIHGTFNTDRTDYLWAPKLEIGEKPTSWTSSIEEMGIDTTIVEDSSGYGHNGEIISELHTSNDTARYNSSTLFDGVDDCIIVPYNTVCPENIFTINLWFKKDAIGTKSYETLFGGPSGFEMDTRAGGATSLSLYMASTRSGNRNSVTSLSLGNWYMVTMTRDGTKEKYYVNGIFQSEIDAKSMPTGVYRIGAWASNDKQNYYGLISDFRIYCTPLLDTDIKQLYNVGMKVDNLGGVHSFELNEQVDNQILDSNLNKDSNITSFIYDKATNTHTITLSSIDSTWGFGIALGTIHKLYIPWNSSYRLTMEVFSSTAGTFVIDYNNYADDMTDMSGNDNDGNNRLASTVTIPANTWTRVTFGATNNNTAKNPHQLPLYDFSHFGMRNQNTNTSLTYQIRNVQWYLVDNTHNIEKNGILNGNHFNETSLATQASIRNKEKSIEASTFIEM